jgi:serine/threonine protein kinase
MPPPANVNELLQLIQKSGLIEDARLRAIVTKLRAAQRPPTLPKELADLFIANKLLTRFQADSLLKGKYKGFVIGEYRVLQPVGVGGMASVYLCERIADGARVAIKVLARERAKKTEIRKRFEREGRAVCNLHHPNIARAYETGSDDKQYYLVMEYVDGWNLEEYLKAHGPPALPAACDIIRQSAVGLQHIAEVGLVHRDIKPANILVNRKGTVKIVDMGLARVLADDAEGLTRPKHVLGTADYIAPEQTFDSHEVDIRADLYCLGMTFYFTLTGMPPFDKMAVDQKIIAHRSKQPKSLVEVRLEVPGTLAAIFDKMTAKDPKRRYQTPAEVVTALGPWC